MLERYSFVPIFSCLIGGLAWWSTQVGPAAHSTFGHGLGQKLERGNSTQSARRRELVEFLDKVVTYERYYRSIYGHYTNSINKVGLRVPRSLMHGYDIRVSEASQSRLVITASALNSVETVPDLATLNQDYNLQANFRVPLPRPAFLKAQALKHLRVLKDAPSGQGVEEQGVYKGYFKFSVRNEDADLAAKAPAQRVVSARGVKAPVAGIFLEFNGRNQSATGVDLEMEMSLLSEAEEVAAGGETLISREGGGEALSEALALYAPANRTGQANESLIIEGNTEEEARLAQEIFHGEMGRYAKSWSELSKIAHFAFDGKDAAPLQVGAQRAISSLPEKHAPTPVRSKNQHGLEIEPLQFDEVGE